MSINVLLGCSLALNAFLALALVNAKLSERGLKEHIEEQRKALLKYHSAGRPPVFVTPIKKAERPEDAE